MALAMVGGMGLVDAVMDLMNVRDNEALLIWQRIWELEFLVNTKVWRRQHH